MIDPVMAADGHTYEREAIEQWLQAHDTSPKTNAKLKHKELTDNHDKRSDILEFLGNHLDLYDGDEIYLPKFWMAQCIIAIKSNQPQEVQRWLDKDRRLLTLKLEGDSTALHLACEFGSPELVDIVLKTLKQRNQSIQPGILGFKSVHLNVLLDKALISGDYVQCELLLRLGAEVGQPEVSTQNTLLHRMVIRDNLEAVNWLLEHKAVLESINVEGNTPLCLSVIQGNAKLVEFLLKMGANLQVRNAKRESPVSIALLSHNKLILALLVGDKKAALPPLHLALELNDSEIIKALLQQQMSVSIESLDEQQRTPFYVSVEKGNIETARLLLEKGANPDVACGSERLTALHIAARRGDVTMLKYLLQTEVISLIDTQNAEGDTPLHLAVKTRDENTILLLLKAGAYPKIKNAEDQTSIELAKVQQTPKLANFILQNIRELKKAKLKETERLHQVVAEQASEMMSLKTKIERLEEQLRLTVLPEPVGNSSVSLAFLPQASPRSVSLHFASVSPAVNQKEVSEFLRLVAEGEQDKAKAMLKSKPALALMPGDVTDLSKRTFTGITGFQYAVWALDWHMWTMIRKRLPDEAAKEQAQGFETGSWVKEHSVHVNLNILIRAYQATLDLYEASKYDECNTAWAEQIGSAQLLLPAHVVNEYCHPARPFYPQPNFKEGLALPRSRTTDNGEWFTQRGKYVRGSNERATAPWGILNHHAGTENAFGRCPKCALLLRMHCACKSIIPEVAMDHKAISALSSTRTSQRHELVNELKPGSVQRRQVA